MRFEIYPATLEMGGRIPHQRRRLAEKEVVEPALVPVGEPLDIGQQQDADSEEDREDNAHGTLVLPH